MMKAWILACTYVSRIQAKTNKLYYIFNVSVTDTG